jgi:hypothetical protein
MVHLPLRVLVPLRMLVRIYLKIWKSAFLAKGAASRDQALERKPSRAWARKMLALMRAKTIVTVSIIADVLEALPDRTERHVAPHSQKNFAPLRKSESD